MSKLNWKNILGVGLAIVAFEGTEHLANIISELRDCLDYVSIGLQRKSYHGDPIEPIDLNEIIRLRDEDHLVDNIVEIDLDTAKEPRVQETDKRNILIQDAEDHGCSHVIVIDSDEFYSRNSFLRALKEIDDNDYEMTYCQYVNYYGNDYKHFLVYPFKDGMYVPFVSKTKYRHSFECQDFPKPSDPTRRYVRPYDSTEDVKLSDGRIYKKKHYTVDYHIFDWKTVKMHHLSCVRADIRKKFNDWSSKTCFENYNDLIDKAVDAYNNFDKDSQEQQDAYLLFNTPDHKVFVKPFPKQYIFPKYDITTRLRPVKKYKKIAIMNLSSTNSDADLFNELDKCAKRTWAKDVVEGNFQNIDYWTVIDTKQDSYVDENAHTIYIKDDKSVSNVQNLLYRWLEACRLIKDKGYEWVLRTNTSTWCNIDVLNEFLADETDDSALYTFKLFAAFWSTFNIYMSGAAMLWPTRNIEILDKIVKETSKDVLNIALDDVMMSALWRKRAQNIKLTNPNKCFNSLEGEYLNDSYENTDFDSINLEIPIFQIKTFVENGEITSKCSHARRLIHDIKKMEELDRLWREHKIINNVDVARIAKDIRTSRMNKTVNLIQYSKQEWINGGLTEEEKSSDMFKHVLPFNEETVQFIENRARECGYKH